MISKKILLLFLLILLQIKSAKGAHGYYGSDIFEVLGIIVGIFFLWGLIRIIQEGNEREETLEEDFEIMDHFFENDLTEE